jgi:hypothetical protein
MIVRVLLVAILGCLEKVTQQGLRVDEHPCMHSENAIVSKYTHRGSWSMPFVSISTAFHIHKTELPSLFHAATCLVALDSVTCSFMPALIPV